MIKNKKGFTLVELLAAIVILGILSVFALPMITGMVENSRNKMYVDDALKLIARAEYQMKASSSSIEKPDQGDCIVITMAYLQANEIITAPNGGEYDPDQSFVVIRNNNDKFEYSVVLVEDLKKGGYKGLKLTPYNVLLSKNAPSYVTPFNDNELLSDPESITKEYINGVLGNDYITGSVSAIYHYHDINDSSVQNVTVSSPVFVGSVEFNRDGSLQAIITFKVKDDDNAFSDLKLFYAVGEKNYPATGENYGNSAVRSLTIDFSKAPYNYNHDSSRKINIYIMVKDPDGNQVETSLEYEIKENVAPTINERNSSVSKRPSDEKNLIEAQVTLDVSDDFDQSADLLICSDDYDTKQAADSAASCSSTFSKIGNESVKTFNYTFHNCDGGCSRDGKTHYLAVFVKDSYNVVSKIVMPYEFSLNQRPRFTSDIVVTGDTTAFPTEGNKNIHVSVRATDDLTSLNKIKVIISDGTVSKEYFYSDDANKNNFAFELSGGYDGNNRTISVVLQDDELLFSDPSQPQSATYKVFKYDGPVISHFSIKSDGPACELEYLCPLENAGTSNGKLSALLEIDVIDHLEAENDYANTSICISEVQSDCDNDANYYSYKDFYLDKEVSYTFRGSYDGSTKRLYAKVKNNNNQFDSKEATYTVYQDSAPVIDTVELISSDGSFPEGQGESKDVYLVITANDDFASDSNLKFTLKKNGTVVLDNQPLSILHRTINMGTEEEPDMQEIYDYLYNVSDTHDGNTYQFQVTVKDDKGNVSEPESVEYKVFHNTAPTLKDNNPVIVFASNHYDVDANFLDLYYYPKFQDDYDKVFNVTFCYSIDGGDTVCKDPVTMTEAYHLTTDNIFEGIDYTGQQISLFAICQDSLDSHMTVQTAPKTFMIYDKRTKPSILDASGTYDEHTNDLNSEEHLSTPLDISVRFQVKDLFDTYKVCITDNPSTCSNYVGPDNTNSTTFDGTDLTVHTLNYTYDDYVDSSTSLYLYAKGTSDTTTNVSKLIISLSPEQNSCNYKDIEHPYYQYTFAGTSGQTKMRSAANACNRKCYHKNNITGEEVTFTAKYKTIIKYRNPANPSNFCSSFQETIAATNMHCDFVECFRNTANNNYVQDAVGIVPINDSGSWVEEINGNIYINYDHYNLYKSSYNAGDQYITLTLQERKLCTSCVDNNLYSGMNYVRVADY